MPARYASGAIRTALFAVLLFAVNVYVCRELFRIEYLNQMGSIEGVYIGLARYIMHNPPTSPGFHSGITGFPFRTPTRLFCIGQSRSSPLSHAPLRLTRITL